MRKRFFPHFAVLWETDGFADPYGALRIKAPVELAVRWEHRSELAESVDGTVRQAVTEVFFKESVDVPVGSIMFEGRLSGMPVAPAPLYRVISQEKVSDIKGRSTCKSVILESFNDSLPTPI